MQLRIASGMPSGYRMDRSGSDDEDDDKCTFPPIAIALEGAAGLLPSVVVLRDSEPGALWRGRLFGAVQGTGAGNVDGKSGVVLAS